jgi:hypothetical protein
MEYTDIDALIAASALPAEISTPFPAHGPFGPQQPHIPEKLNYSQVPSATIFNEGSVDPWKGKRCAIKRCGSGAQVAIGGTVGLTESRSFFQPKLRNTESLTAQIEMATSRAYTAQQVAEIEPTFLCVYHAGEYSRVREAKAQAAREATSPPAYPPLNSISPDGATIEIENGTTIVITAEDGTVVKTEVFRAHEVEVWRRSGKFMAEPLTPDEVKAVKEAVRLGQLDVKAVAELAAVYGTNTAQYGSFPASAHAELAIDVVSGQVTPLS